jgi:hypothetical protein
MSIVVINHYSDGLRDYKKALENVSEQIFYITNKKQENSYRDVFTNRIIFENLYEDDNVQKEIEKINDIDKVTHIIATHEFDLEVIGKLRDKLGITGQSESNALKYRDKYIMKEAVKDLVKVPKFMYVADKSDLRKNAQILKYPVVVKPFTGAGSVGVSIIHDENELESLDDGIFPLLSEEYITGNEMYHVDGIFHKNKFLIVKPAKYINGCLAFKEDKLVGSMLLDSTNMLYSDLVQKTQKIIETLGTTAHPMAFHVEFFYEHGELIFCEIASRGGGGKINETIREKTGIDLFVESVKAQLSENYTLDYDENLEKQGTYGFVLIPFKSGKLINITRTCPFDWVKKYFIKTHKIGQTFNGAQYSVSEVVSAIVVGKNEMEVVRRISDFGSWIENNISWEDISE